MTKDVPSQSGRLAEEAPAMPPAGSPGSVGGQPEADSQAARADVAIPGDSGESGGWELPQLFIPAHPIEPRGGTLAGKWRIEAPLGAGGFGRVYSASPTAAGQTQKVAIKFLDFAPDKVKRFENERQMLSDLDHPGICRFIDGGTAPDGAPYLVMPLVQGLPITLHCDDNNLTVTQRLKLFVEVCDAVEYAHQHGLWHRDLTPKNILVTEKGTVCVVDFGLAKRFESSERLTTLGKLPWTRGYASPEQVSGGELSFATDVYALGVILYELLTGFRPFRDDSLPLTELLRVIKEQEPKPPSQAVMTAVGEDEIARTPYRSARLRRSSPRRLKRQLKGNIDAVVLKALRKDPLQRYSRVERLKSDVEMVLEGFPVSARRCGSWERVRNRVVKRPVAVAVMLASILPLIYVMARGFPLQVADEEAIHAGEVSELRLRRLIEIGLPEIEDALPQGPEAKAARRTAASIHTHFLQSAEVLPAYTLRDLESSLAVSALRCAREWKDLGDPAAALAVTAPFLPRAVTRYESDRLDGQRRQILIEIVRQRVALHKSLHQENEAAGEIRLLQETLRKGP